jgi:hypothetical protein
MDNNAGLTLYYIVLLVFYVLYVAGTWKMFEKAGEEGWKAIIPFYNLYIYFRLAGRNGWGFFLLFIPIASLVVSIIVAIDLAKHFNKSAAWGFFLLWLLPFIGTLMLGFGEDEYAGPKHA